MPFVLSEVALLLNAMIPVSIAVFTFWHDYVDINAGGENVVIDNDGDSAIDVVVGNDAFEELVFSRS